MAKDEINISGEKLLALKNPLERMAEFATRLRISLRTATELTKPGTHSMRMDTLDKIAAGLNTDRAGVFSRIGFAPHATNPPSSMSAGHVEFPGPKLAELIQELKHTTPRGFANQIGWAVDRLRVNETPARMTLEEFLILSGKLGIDQDELYRRLTGQPSKPQQTIAEFAEAAKREVGTRPVDYYAEYSAEELERLGREMIEAAAKKRQQGGGKKRR